MAIQTVGVLGFGLMGAGIAQVCAQSGYRTIVRDVNDAALAKGRGRVEKFLNDGIAKGKVKRMVLAGRLGKKSGGGFYDYS